MKTLVSNNTNLFSSIPSLLNNLLNDEWMDPSFSNRRTTDGSIPAVNVKETNDDFQIEVAAPGMKRDDFNVELDNDVLTISAQHSQERSDTTDMMEYSRREFSYQDFQRSFALPENKVEGDKIAARYIDGILHITIPKREEAKVRPARQIKVG